MKTCPKCGSEDINLIKYQGIECVVCKKCGYDEREEYDVYPEEKVSQKEKARYTPYKIGGGRRTE